MLAPRTCECLAIKSDSRAYFLDVPEFELSQCWSESARSVKSSSLAEQSILYAFSDCKITTLNGLTIGISFLRSHGALVKSMFLIQESGILDMPEWYSCMNGFHEPGRLKLT